MNAVNRPSAGRARALAVLLAASGFGLANPAVAQEEAESPVAALQAAIDGVDPLFGEYVVNPIAQVLFQDLVFWDDGRSKVVAAAYLEDGTLLSGGLDGALVTYRDGEPVVFDPEVGAIRSVAVGGSRIAVAGEKGLQLLTGFGAVPEMVEGVDDARVVAFGPAGSTLYVGTGHGELIAVPTDGGTPKGKYREAGVEIVAVAADTSTTVGRVAFATSKKGLFVSDGEGSPVALEGHRRGVSALAFGPDGTLATGGLDGRVLLYAPGQTKPLGGPIEEQGSAPVALGFASSTRLLVARPGSVAVLDRVDGRWKPTHTVGGPIISMAVGPDGKEAAVTRDQGQVSRIYLDSGKKIGPWAGHSTEINLPIIVVWLVVGAVFFTLRFGFINLRAFKHAIDVTRGKYDGEHDDGDVSHFQALAMALSATVGLGNIAGVAVAVGAGGPGAVFWMIVAGFLGMSSKFAECTLGQMYRRSDKTGKVTGGPMHYLHAGLSEMGMAKLGKVLSVLFAVLCIGGSFGGGNMFQANQSYAQVSSVIPLLKGDIGALIYGLVLSGIVGVVIIGGIERIGQVASYIVPFMVGIYILAALFIVLSHAMMIPSAFVEIIRSAFTPGAAYGGAIGVMVQGFRRAAFSNEAGVGSASIAHSAAATKEPIREGIVALLEPFIDTIVVCTTTALVLVITGAHDSAADGVVMTSNAFATVLPWFPKVLTVAVFLFAFSTMISWSYYGERCWGYLFGEGSSLVYKILFVLAVIVGSVVELGSVLTFSDLMILSMAFPNILGVALLSGKVRARLNDYMGRLRSGAMVPTE